MPHDLLPEWVEPMAATLTQERFTGPEWIFERKLDGIRLLAFRNGPDVRLLSRNRLPQNAHTRPSSRRSPTCRCPTSSSTARPPACGAMARGRQAGYHVFDILWLEGRDVTRLPLEERRALLSSCPSARPLHRVTALERSEAVGARVQRGLGGRDCEAARLAVRAPALAALAEDEVRGDAGARGRRLHRSAGRARRAGRTARRLF